MDTITRGVRHHVAIHEAGHAVTALLLGHHVISASLDVQAHGKGWATVRGDTPYAKLNDAVLTNLVITAAGEVALRHLLELDKRPDAADLARDSAIHDIPAMQTLLSKTTLPAQAGPLLAASLVKSHWPAIQRLAKALHETPGHRLEADEVLDAAALGSAEIGWEMLTGMARLVMPGDAGVEAYITGPGRADEESRAEFLNTLRVHGLLKTPATALRREIDAEVYNRRFALDAELEAAVQMGEPR